MAEYKKQAQTAPKQGAPKQSAQTAQTAQTPVIRAKIDSLVNDEESKVKAYASVTIGGMFAVHGVRVYRTQQGGNYVSMPYNQYKDAEGNTQFSEICHPVTADLRHQLTQTVMTAYDQALQEAQQQGVKETQDNAPKIKPEM